MKDSDNSTTKSMDISLQDAKKHLRDNYREGTTCMCCGQHVRLYRRPLNASMCAVLVILAHIDASRTSYIHIEDMLKKLNKAHLRGDFHKLVLWGFLKAKSDQRPDGSPRNGYYRLTDEGYRFACGMELAPSHVLIYNNKVQGLSTKMIHITDAMKNKFDFNELLKDVA